MVPRYAGNQKAPKIFPAAAFRNTNAAFVFNNYPLADSGAEAASTNNFLVRMFY